MTEQPTPTTVSGLPPDLSSGETMTPWECEQKIKAVLAALPPSVPAPEHDINCGIDALRLGQDIGCTCGADRESEPPSAPPALDVERLAQAFHHKGIAWPANWGNDDYRWIARAVAAEYARLEQDQ